MQVPESVAFSFVAGISPTRGMYSTFFMGIFGGVVTTMPGMVSGIAGGMVSIQKELTDDNGPLGDYCLMDRAEWVFASSLVCGVIQMILSFLGVAKLLKLVPHSVMVGFLNGLAIIILRAQLGAFQVDKSGSPTMFEDKEGCPTPDYVPPRDQRWLKFNEAEFWQVTIIVVLSAAIMILQPKIKKRIKIGKFSIGSNIVPPSLVIMVICTLISSPIKTIGDMTTFPGGLPKGTVPKVPWSSGKFWKIIIEKSALLSIVGLVESVMTWEMCQKIVGSNLPPSRANVDCLGQGLGNFISSFFSSAGGSVMVGQTAVNLLNGSRSRLSSVVASFIILIFVSVAGRLIELIPVAALTGILFVVVAKTFEWRTFVYMFRRSIPFTDVISIILVAVLSVVTDLAIGVVAGVAWCSVVMAWKLAKETRLKVNTTTHVERTSLSSNSSGNIIAVIKVSGAIFFGSSSMIEHELVRDSDTINLCPIVFLNLEDATIYDSSGVEVIKNIVRELDNGERKIFISKLDQRSLKLLTRSQKLVRVVTLSNEVLEGIEVDGGCLRETERSERSSWVGKGADGRLKDEVRSIISHPEGQH
ncbi:sulfate transporter family-domain-containing protein [Coemansia mojavensis]|nr:sulfate transporter family-domain-containing protein [Coemansia mojavensis]